MRKVTAILLLAFAYVGFASAGDVTFQLNMKIKMQEGTFLPGSGDIVRVAGGFNNWGSSTDTLTDANNDSIYTKTITIADGGIEYKFLKTLRAGGDWESVSNRAYTVIAGAQTIPVVYFDNDSIYSPPLAKVPVTFQVKMNIKMREGAFQPGSGDIVRVAGSFNGWGGSTDTLRDGDNDSTYTVTVQLDEAASINYKFLKTLRGGSDWEGDPNRDYTVPAGGGTIPAVYFDRDSIYTPPVPSPVVFQINMKMKLLEGTFRPDLGDFCTVRGNFNGWGDVANVDTLTDANNDSIYTRTVNINEAFLVKYKFWKSLRGNLSYENVPDQSYTVPIGGGTVGLRWFDNDSVYNGPVTANILWRVDMNAYQTLGWFRPDFNDSIEVRGSFDSWAGTKMIPTPGQPGKYQYTQSGFSGTAGDVVFHKFFLDLDSATAVARFPGYVHSGTGANRDSYAYDHPASTGDGNRTFTVASSGNLQVPRPYFSDINPMGLMDAQDSVNVTLRVNMNPAMQYADPFVPGTDSLFLVWPDLNGFWRSQLIKNVGAFPTQWEMSKSTDPLDGDSIYVVSFKLKGPLHYSLMYFYRYKAPGVGGRVVDQTGGLGASNPFTSRFIPPLGPNSFPASYTAPTDTWKKQAPFLAENPPFSTDVIPAGNEGIPQVYALEQNYPNPFNPSTHIRYSIPEEAKVTLSVYNLLGQRVATLVNETQRAGSYIATFEGNYVATGIYFYKLESGKFTQVRKMLLMK